MGCPPWAKDCRPLRPAAGSTGRRAPRHVGRAPNRARKPVQKPGLARVVTDRPVTTLAGDGGTAEAQGERGTRFARNSRISSSREGLCRPQGPVCAPSRARGSADCGDGALLPVRRRYSLGASAAMRIGGLWDRPIALYDVLRRRRATRVAEVADLLTLHAPFALPGVVATLPGRNSGPRTLRIRGGA